MIKIILAKHCKSLTGSLGQGFGYHIEQRKNGFFGKRNTKGIVPHDGEWKFILACANLAYAKLHIADILVNNEELWHALRDANHHMAAQVVLENAKNGVKTSYNARDIINLQISFGL